MTVKNGGRYIRDAVKSIQAQDVDDWETVIVDDGSRDGTTAYLHELSEKDARFRIKLTAGIGRGAALNIAVSMCRAEFLTNLDADDLAHPARIRTLIKLFHDYPNYAAISGASIVFMGNDLPLWPKSSDKKLFVEDVTQMLPFTNPICHSGVALRKTSLFNAGMYDKSRRSQFDYELWVRLAERGYRIGRTGATIAAKRSHEQQSFERTKHLRYAYQSAMIQWRAISAVGANWFLAAMSIALHLFWAFVPVRFRMLVRRSGLLSHKLIF